MGTRMEIRGASRSALGAEIRTLSRRIVVQVLPEPPLDFSYAHPLAFAVVGDLIAVNLTEAEIARFRMGEVKATHA